MATTDFVPFVAAHQGSSVKRAAEAAAAFLSAVFKARRNRKATRGLLEFDDRMLRDIGLTRGDVRSALSCRFDEDPTYRLTVFSASHAAHRGQAVRRDV